MIDSLPTHDTGNAILQDCTAVSDQSIGTGQASKEPIKASLDPTQKMKGNSSPRTINLMPFGNGPLRLMHS